MNYYSTKNKQNRASFKEAVLTGIAPDGGLYMPAEIPRLSANNISELDKLSFVETSFIMARPFIDDIPDQDLQVIIDDTLGFDAPVHTLSDELSILELFHGPTLAFKDFGARFLARILAWYNRQEKHEWHILVATSGDTGSAVANGFLNVPGVKVHLLYPSGKVSKIQEQQLTTLGQNISAYEVDGTFDDCQRLVKQAFADSDLRQKLKMTSANSINIARLLPQSFYYIHAWAQIMRDFPEPVICVPCGNFGNITAGLFAARAGIPIKKFIAATNSNTVFPEYLQTGTYRPRPSVLTHSNAMDVGDPSNFQRLMALFDEQHAAIRQSILSGSATDGQTLQAMRDAFNSTGYILDPHGAVGFHVWTNFQISGKFDHTVLLETAHPAKFKDVVDPALDITVTMPERLQRCLDLPKKALKLSGRFFDFKSVLLG